MALAPDLYHGKTTASVEEARALGAALDQDVERWHGEIAAALQFLRQHEATHRADGRDKLAFVAFSLGGAYALDLSITEARRSPPSSPFMPPTPDWTIAKLRPPTSATSQRMTPSSRLSRSHRWSRSCGLRAGRPPSIRI